MVSRALFEAAARRAAMWLLPPLLAVSACVPTPEKRPRVVTPRVEDPWTKTTTVPEWLYVTSDAGGSKEAECGAVLTWVRKEAVCKGRLCEHGRDLAASWLERCSTIAPGDVDEVKGRREALATAAAGPSSACVDEAEALLRDECGGEGTTWREAAQRWATRCARSDGSPLVMLILGRLVERRAEEGADEPLDPRSCDELAKDLAGAAACAQRFPCEDAVRRVLAFRARCDAIQAPPVATAVIELSILAGAQRESPPVAAAATPGRVAPGDVPLALESGLGAVYRVCEDRVIDLPGYLASRRACDAGRLAVGHVFKAPDGRGIEVRLGAIDVAGGDAVVARRMPSLRVAGEAAARAAEELPALEGELTHVVGPAGPAESARILARAVVAHARALRRSPDALGALAQHDAELAPAFRELGRAKATASTRVSAAERPAFAVRARRPFADVTPEGAVVAGAFSRDAAMLELAERLPRSMAEYEAGLGGLVKLAREARPGSRAADLASRHAATCGEAERRFRDAERTLVACGFSDAPCDAARVEGLAREIDDAQAAAERAYDEFARLRLGSPGSAGDAMDATATAALCSEPWW
jgi:hypothetical protein